LSVELSVYQSLTAACREIQKAYWDYVKNWNPMIFLTLLYLTLHVSARLCPLKNGRQTFNKPHISPCYLDG